MTLPLDFIRYFTDRALHFRSVAHARRHLIADWRNGVSIPGYGTREKWSLLNLPSDERRSFLADPTALPRGWSLNSLYLATPSRAVIARGRTAPAPTAAIAIAAAGL